MNENLNLVEILKDCKKGTKLYSTTYGDVELYEVDINLIYPIRVWCSWHKVVGFTFDGKILDHCDGECVLFPSREQRDWSKFKPKNPKFDPKTLQPFDRVLVRDSKVEYWSCDLFSNFINVDGICQFLCVGSVFKCAIPYNDETEYLLGTNEEAPEFYRYLEK